MNTDRIQINGNVLVPEDIQEKLNHSNLPEWEKGIYEFILNWFDKSDFILQHTSGSTGTPKEIELKKSTMQASAKKTVHYFNLQKNETAWLCLPIEYIAGKMMVVRALIGQLNLIITEPKGIPQLPDVPVDFTAMVPLQMQKLLDTNANFQSIQKLIIGGAAIDTILADKIKQVPTEIYASYGMTETCSHIALQRLNGSRPDSNFKILEGVAISKNSEGCIVVQAPDLSDHQIETHDLVEIISENEFKLLGRADNIINSGGFKISPELLENEISKIIGMECIVIPEHDALLGQKLVVLVEGVENRTLAATLLEKIKFRIGKHRSPKAMRFISHFPRNSSMKIDRQKAISQTGSRL